MNKIICAILFLALIGCATSITPEVQAKCYTQKISAGSCWVGYEVKGIIDRYDEGDREFCCPIPEL